VKQGSIIRGSEVRNLSFGGHSQVKRETKALSFGAQEKNDEE
jgi:hypothetical protein